MEWHNQENLYGARAHKSTRPILVASLVVHITIPTCAADLRRRAPVLMHNLQGSFRLSIQLFIRWSTPGGSHAFISCLS